MRKHTCKYTVIASLLLISGAANAFDKLNLYGTTTSYSFGDILQLFIYVDNVNGGHPPDYMSTISITAPTGDTFSVGQDDWDHQGQSYYFGLEGSDFSGGTIPAGRYEVSGMDKDGGSLSSFNIITFKPMTIPTIVSPTASEVVTSRSPRFSWTKPVGTVEFRVQIDDLSAKTPVYSFVYADERDLRLTTTAFNVPRGVLKSGRNYRIRIEARNYYGSVRSRSRSDWVEFSTSW